MVLQADQFQKHTVEKGIIVKELQKIIQRDFNQSDLSFRHRPSGVRMTAEYRCCTEKLSFCYNAQDHFLPRLQCADHFDHPLVDKGEFLRLVPLFENDFILLERTDGGQFGQFEGEFMMQVLEQCQADIENAYEEGKNDGLSMCEDTDDNAANHAYYSIETGLLNIPALDVPGPFGNTFTYRVQMKMKFFRDHVGFILMSAEPLH